jgi:glycine/D-amino acid oxidase-like deaminating enzyme
MTSDRAAADRAAAPYRQLSLWHDTFPGSWEPRPALPGDTTVDVAIVGAGYTGLWTAYHLASADPGMRIAVVERDVAGFGASGRNGGWCSALFPTSWHRMRREADAGSVTAMQRALEAAVDEVGRTAAAEGIDCAFVKGGSVSVARNPAQLARARAHVAEAREHGFGPDTLDLLDGPETARRVGAAGALGAVVTDHCAALDPARLVRGLAEAVERRGVRIYEGTAALEVSPGRVRTRHGTVLADVVLPATEGYTPALPGRRRDLAPVYSLMLATEPLPEDVWAQIGLADRATFSDERHLTIYGQRTADGRIAFGGRGAPYHFASRISPAYDHDDRVHEAIRSSLVDLFPVLRDVTVTHRWGGNLGVPRDWYPSVGFDRRTGLAWAGGYVGDGVATSNLAGRTVADLVLGRDTGLTGLPWVRRRTKAWEPEPLRWLGVNAVTALMTHADRTEQRTGRPSRAAAAFWRTLGH